MEMEITARQGDVGLMPIEKLRGKKIKNRPVAFGEVTGHSHRIVDFPKDLQVNMKNKKFGSNVLVLDNPINKEADQQLMKQDISATLEMYQDDKGTLMLKIKNKSAIVHEEHMTQIIEPGIYEYVPEMEHDPWKGMRAVTD